MIFTAANALAVVKHYQFLKGRDMQGGDETPITNIAIAPIDDDQLDAFFDASKSGDTTKALHTAGYDKSQVQVILMNEENDGVDLWEEIDSYLEKNKLEKVYLNPDFFKA